MGFTYHKIFDETKLRELYEDDMETVQLMFESFIFGVLPEYPKLKQYTAEENWTAVKDLSHKILPTFAMLGLMDIHEDLRKIEDLCKQEEYQQIPKKVHKVDKKVSKIRPIVNKEFERIQIYLKA